MNEYDELLTAFSKVLENSADYHIAYIYHIGYVSMIGVWETEQGENKPSVWIDEVFHTPYQMAESFLRNWRWQWLRNNRAVIQSKDYDDIVELDNNIPDELKEVYKNELHNWEEKIGIILDKK